MKRTLVKAKRSIGTIMTSTVLDCLPFLQTVPVCLSPDSKNPAVLRHLLWLPGWNLHWHNPGTSSHLESLQTQLAGQNYSSRYNLCSYRSSMAAHYISLILLCGCLSVMIHLIYFFVLLSFSCLFLRQL